MPTPGRGTGRKKNQGTARRFFGLRTSGKQQLRRVKHQEVGMGNPRTCGASFKGTNPNNPSTDGTKYYKCGKLPRHPGPHGRGVKIK